MNKFRFLLCFFIVASVPSFAQTESNYTPPPMFGTPVITPQPQPTPAPTPAPTVQPPIISPPAPVATNKPISIIPTIETPPVQNPVVTKPVQPPYVAQQNAQQPTAPIQLEPQTAVPPVTVTPTTATPIVVPASPEEPPKKVVQPIPQQTKSAPVKSASPEDLLDHPVTATPSPNTIDPLMASQIAKSKMPKPKDGETIDDTGVDPSKVRYPNKKSVTPIKPAKPIVETTPKTNEKPKTKSKDITTEQQKMPVVTTKKVDELSLAPMADVKNSPAPTDKPKVTSTPTTTTSPTKQSLKFAAGAGDITPAHKTSLGGIVSALKAKPSTRAQILSYATPTNATGSTSARRVSLTRGLAIRTYLLSQGVDGGRVEVRALGDQKGDETGGKGTLDQADIVIME
jgi:outer membrane protein OmpA-like peptidoglycan-associated protein